MILKIYRMATQNDIDSKQSRQKEVQKRSREINTCLRLEMKISDVEFQGDGSKTTFYYTADNQVDFRQLVEALKPLAFALKWQVD